MDEQRTRHASFSTEDESREPVTFDIDGETFYCAAHIPGDTLLYYVDMLIPKNGQGAMLSREQLWEFYGEALPVDERERFEKFVHDPTRFVKLELLARIMAHLVGEYQGGGTDPTLRRGQSARGRPKTGRGSAASS